MTQRELMAGRGDGAEQVAADLRRIEEMTRAPGRPLRRKADWAGEPCPAGCVCDSCESRR